MSFKVVLWLAVIGVGAAKAEVYSVNSTLDSTDFDPGDMVCESASGNGICTLRAAIQEANANGMATISLPAGSFVLGLPGRVEDASASGDLDVSGSIQIDGAGTQLTVIDADGIDRAIHVLPSGNLALNALTVRGGVVTDSCAVGCRGGGIYNETGILAMNTVRITDNRASFGAGIDATGDVTLVSSAVDLNIAATEGGGVRASGGASVSLIDCNVEGNQARSGGGFENFSGAMRIQRTSIHGNDATAGRAGGMEQLGSGSVLVENSTFSNNTSATTGGAIYVSGGLVELRNVTVADNQAQSGGGVFVEPAGTLELANSILADNVDSIQNPQDCEGTVDSLGYNLIETTTDCTISGDSVGNKTGQDPVLDVLGDNGGPTPTHFLLAGSPAIDAGDVAGCEDLDGSSLTVDQRGFSRPVDGGGGPRCDIGAIEVAEPGAGLLAWAALLSVAALRRSRALLRLRTFWPRGAATETP